MAKFSYSPETDQFDEKIFRESLGTFSVTSMPGANQLQEIQAKVRQGVKNVELVMLGRGKGNSGQLDTPDKYGEGQRKTIMQLAKLNNINLSVHTSPEMVSFSGLTQQGGFDEASRWEALKEVDETVKFAAETAKGGAVVMHLQGEGLSSSRSELNLSKRYLDWLKKNNEKEYENLKKNYFTKNPLDRQFVNNPEKRQEFKFDYEKLDKETRNEFEKQNAEEIKKGAKPWELFYEERQTDKVKLNPELYPAVVVGDKITQVERQQEFIDIEILKKEKNLTQQDKELLKKAGIFTGNKFSIDDFQKAMAIFSNSKPKDLEINDNDFKKLQDKILVTYDKFLEENNNLQSQADIEFFKKQVDMQVNMYELQKKKLEQKKSMFQDELTRIDKLEEESKNAFTQMNEIDNSTEKGKAARDALKNFIYTKNQELQQLKYSVVGQENYHELANFDNTIAEINKKKKELSKQVKDAKSLTDESFDKNVSGLSYMGIKALNYQLELKDKSKQAQKTLPKLQDELKQLKEQYYKEKNYQKQDKIANKIAQKESEVKKWTGLKDYSDIDIENRPLYISPENMLPGMGSLTSIEEYKAVIRMSQEDFASKILSDDPNFENIKEKYEKETGKQIKNHDDAMKLAKKHLAGTFDTAHAGSWLKHFKKIEGETDEQRYERFNTWIKDQAKELVEEGLVKHVHLNDTTGKDDDHNLLGDGFLDIHGLRKTLRSAGIKEPFVTEAGGRGANKNLHLTKAFDEFNPRLEGGGELRTNPAITSNVSDWIGVERNYQRRPQYSGYGMSENTFVHNPPQQGQEKGNWSGTSFF